MLKFFQLRVPPLVVMLFWAVFIWLVSQADLNQIEVRGQVWLAGALGVLGLAIAASGVLEFRKARTTVDPLHPNRAAQLVTSSVYRFTRNPMYVGMMFVLLAWAIYLGSILGLGITLLFVVYMNRFQIGPEEQMLLRKFGGVYQRYRRRVRRWL